ncbi:MAG: hypothetical protein H6772_02485 [Pseudomonadales bacterium]|nr:hypothetical protein [Pseudomonadales bacterium]
MAIASRGYIDEGRFLPFYPALINTFSQPIIYFLGNKPYGPTTFWTGLVISNGLFLVSLFLLQKLLLLDYKKMFINKILLLLLIAPTSFFFVSLYSESLFLLLSLVALFFARKKRWLLAILVSMFLAITRLPGFLIAIPLLYEYFFENKIKTDLKKTFASIGFLFIPILLVVYAFFNYIKWGDPLFFINAHGLLGNDRVVNTFVFPLITLFRYVKIFFGISPFQYEFYVALIEFGSLIFALIGIFFGFKNKIRTSYLIYTVLLLFLPLLSGTLSGFPRYIIPAFPIFIGFAHKINFKNISGKIYFLINLIFQIIFLALFSRGYFIA